MELELPSVEVNLGEWLSDGLGLTAGVLTRVDDGRRVSTARGIFKAWAIGCNDRSFRMKQV